MKAKTITISSVGAILAGIVAWQAIDWPFAMKKEMMSEFALVHCHQSEIFIYLNTDGLNSANKELEVNPESQTIQEAIRTYESKLAKATNEKTTYCKE